MDVFPSNVTTTLVVVPHLREEGAPSAFIAVFAGRKKPPPYGDFLFIHAVRQPAANRYLSTYRDHGDLQVWVGRQSISPIVVVPRSYRCTKRVMTPVTSVPMKPLEASLSYQVRPPSEPFGGRLPPMLSSLKMTFIQFLICPAPEEISILLPSVGARRPARPRLQGTHPTRRGRIQVHCLLAKTVTCRMSILFH